MAADPIDRVTTLGTIRVTFDEPIDPATVSAADVTVKTPGGATIPTANLSVTPVQTAVGPGGPIFGAIDIVVSPAQSALGLYEVTIGPGISNTVGLAMDQDGDGTPGGAGDAFVTSVEVRTLTTVNFVIGTQTWSGTIHVTGDVTVAAGATLTILPGKVIKFNSARQFDSEGTVIALGTAQQPIIFTSVNDDSAGGDISGVGVGTPGRGDWRRLLLDGPGTTIDFRHVEVRFAGDSNGGGFGGDEPAVTLNSPNVIFEDVKVIESRQTGIFIEGGDPALRRVSVQGAGVDGFFINSVATPTLEDLSVTGVGRVGVGYQGGTIGTVTWDFGGLPVHVFNNVQVAAGGTLTIVPGQVVKMATSMLLDIFGTLDAQGTADGQVVKFTTTAFLDVDGKINAVGTAAQPIVFTSFHDDTAGGDSNFNGAATTPVRGDWRALFLDGGDSGAVLTHVELRYAGDNNGPGGFGGEEPTIVINKPGTVLTNVVIRDVSSTGVHLLGGKPTLNTVRVSRAGGVAFFAERAVESVLTNLSAAQTGGNHYQLRNGKLPTTRTWTFGGLPLHMAGSLTIPVGVTLTISAGTVVKMPNAAFFDVNGTMLAVGTAPLPIIFTTVLDDTVGGDSNSDGGATTPVAGNWRTAPRDQLERHAHLHPGPQLPR